MSKKNKPVKNKNVKTFSISNLMMADLMFFLRPFKERQQEAMFWSKRLQQVQKEIIRDQAIDPDKYSVDWEKAYETGKVVCVKIPKPVCVASEALLESTQREADEAMERFKKKKKKNG